MKNIETPLTWGLGVLAIVLIVLSSLNSTSADFNISNVNSDVNDGFNLNHDHQIQKASSFNVKDPNMGIAAMAKAVGGQVIFDEGDQKIIMIDDMDSSSAVKFIDDLKLQGAEILSEVILEDNSEK
jgi:hypothetical protein